MSECLGLREWVLGCAEVCASGCLGVPRCAWVSALKDCARVSASVCMGECLGVPYRIVHE